MYRSVRLLSPWLSCAGLAFLLLGGCSEDMVCLSIDTECEPLYPATFDNVYNTTLVPKCGVAGSACHAREGAAGGLIFADIDESYQQLTDQARSGALVDFDNLGCGALLARVGSQTASFVMPPGAPLDDAELCAIRQWVALGAER